MRRHIRFAPLHGLLFAVALIAANGFAPAADRRTDPRSVRARRSGRLRASSTHSVLIDWIVGTLVLIVVFAVAIAIGVMVPGLVAMKLLYEGGWIVYGPHTPGLLWAAARYTLIAAAVIVVVGRLVGLRRHGFFVGTYLAMLFTYALVLPLVLSTLLILPVHLVAWNLFDIDAWREWRPLLHVALAVIGAILALWMHFGARRDLYDYLPLSVTRRRPRAARIRYRHQA